jgi:two-component sensor histidine kinase/HAMP domain-containing protein
MLKNYRPFSRNSLGGQVMSMLGISLVSTLVLFSLSVFYFVNRSESVAWQGRQTEAARNAAGTVAGFIQRVGDALVVISAVEPVYLATGSDGLDKLNALIQKNPAFLEIIRTDSSGHIFASTSRDKSVLTNLITIPQSQWFLQARKGQTFLGEVQLSANNKPYLIMAVPSADQGVVAARVEMNVLWEVVKNIHFGKSGEVIVITDTGNIIAHTNPEFVISRQSLLSRPELLGMLSAPNNEWSGSYTNFHNEQVVGATAPVPGTNWIVITELPRAEAFASSRNAIIVLSIEAFLLMLVASLIVVRFVRILIVKPMDHLRDGAERIGQGDLNHRINLTRKDEIGQLAVAFDSMATDLEKQHNALRDQAEELEQRVAERTAELLTLNTSLEKEVAERKGAEEQARASLQEKEVLLKEIHHRVKNNLQIITSLLNLQTDQVKDTGTLRALRDSQARVRSMALIHEKLYQSKSLAKIDFGEYVQSLVNDLFRSYQRSLGVIELDVQVDEVALNLDYAVPCGLILNELITNALKYAFPNGRKGVLHIELRTELNQTLHLRVADNGVGLPAGLDVFTSKSLGLQLVNSLVAQIGGTLAVESGEGAGFLVSFTY